MTKCRIGFFNAPTVMSVYCHHDGYPSYTGKFLLENYSTFGDVVALIDHGDMSCLGATLEDCEFYHRDNKEDWEEVSPLEHESIETYLDECLSMDYAYLFYEGEWFYRKGRGDLVALTMKACTQK